MSLFSRQSARAPGQTAEQLIPGRGGGKVGGVSVTRETALRHSAVWASLRLRANLISTLPQDVFRKVGGVQVEVPTPPVLEKPGGEQVDLLEWMYSSQFDVDRAGNCFGLITARDGLGLPARIELQPLAECAVQLRKGVLKYRIAGVEYEPRDVWHEKQYTVAGLPVGLSPIAFAAWSIGEYLSIQDFALDWFGNGGVPSAHLKNTKKQTLTAGEAANVKQVFRAATQGGEMFVSGSDWEFKPINAEASAMNWVDAKQYSIADIARFFDVPADLIDGAVSTGSITYANVTQRNLQFLVMSLGPAITRRENALSKLTVPPRFVKFNTDALLRMDPQARATTIKTRLDSRTLTPNEARALENLPPLTAADLAEFAQVYGAPKSATPSSGSPVVIP